MKRLLLALTSLFLASSTLFGEDLSVNISDLSNGIVNQVDSMLIPDNAVAEARNVWFDDTSMVKKRQGMAKVNASAIGGGGTVYNQFEFRKSNGTNYHIAVASQTLYYRTGGSTWTAFQASVSTATSIANFEVFMDTLQFCNGSDNLRYWDTTKVGTTTTAYQPKYLLAWQNRLWIAGDPDEPSALRSSEYLDPFTYTIPTSNAVSTDPVLFDINSQDGQKIKGIVKSPNGNLLVLKDRSSWEIGGTDRDDFFLRLVSPDIGAVDGASYVFKEGRATWLSTLGFVEYDGNNIKIISKPIQGTMDTVTQIIPGNGEFEKNSQSQWQTFSSTSYIDSSTTPGSITNQYITTAGVSMRSDLSSQIVKIGEKYVVILSTASADTGAPYGDGLMSFVFQDGVYLASATISNGALGMGRTRHNVAEVDSSNKIHLVYFGPPVGTSRYDIYYATSTDGINWTSVVVDTEPIVSSEGYYLAPEWDNTTTPYRNAVCGLSLALDSSGKPHIIFDDTAVDLGVNLNRYRIQYWYYDTQWNNGGVIGLDLAYYNSTLAIDSDNHLNIATISGDDNTHYVIHATSGASTSYTVSSTGYVAASSSLYADFPSMSIGIDSDDKIYMTYGYYLITNKSGSWSRVALPNYSEYAVLRVGGDDVPRVVSRGSGITQQTAFYEYVPTSGIFISTQVLHSPNVLYSRPDLYVGNDSKPAVFKVASQWTGNGQLVTSTATYVSDVWDTGYGNGVVFDMFTTQQTDNDYYVTHYIRSSGTSSGISSESWTSVTPSATPSLTGYRYIQYKCEISTDTITADVPSIDLVNISYHSSAGLNRPSSMFYNQRVYNAVSVSSATVLDRLVIYDQNDRWTEHSSAINATSLLNFNGKPYLGSDDGFVYQMDIGDDDDGNPINAYFLTKSYSLGPYYRKNLSKLFVLADDSGNYNLNLDYYLDRETTAHETFAIDLDQTSGIINYKVPLTKNDPFGLVQFKVYNANDDEPFDLYGLSFHYRMQPLR